MSVEVDLIFTCWMVYCLLGCVVTILLFTQGTYESSLEMLEELGMEDQKEILILSFIITGIFLYPFILLALLVNGFNWR